MIRKSYTFLSYILIGVVLANSSCNPSETRTSIKADSATIYLSIPESPVLSAEEALNTFVLEKEFSIEIVASDPLISDPVAIDFDEKGRIWVVELNGYMPNLEGSGEDIPNGKIKILSDENGDGKMDKSSVFLDSLVLPRALRLVYNGLLWAEPPNLFFSEIVNDKPVNTILIDSAYAVGGNVEHQPNGLLVGMDNWIYSAKSSKRYKRKKGVWLIENTEFRGQWGITMDSYGRLLYNDNSNQLRGDYYSPGIVSSANLSSALGIGIQVVEDQRVYPSRPNTGINRGYLPDMLDDSLRLARFTAASGPVVFRSNNWGDDFNGNAFVPEPAGNLIKRNILKDSVLGLNGKQAYKKKEFLTSTDERFRPVNLNVSLDGNLYVVDFYRGLIQHKTYVSEYLKTEVERRKLDSPVGLGRIYRIKPDKRLSEYNDSFKSSGNTLIDSLFSSNGWIRDKAQQTLILTEVKDKKALLTVLNSPNDIASIHALWTLEGLDILEIEDLENFFEKANSYQVINGLIALKSCINSKNANKALAIAGNLYAKDLELKVVFALMDFLNTLQKYKLAESSAITKKLFTDYSENPYMRELTLILMSKNVAAYKSLLNNRKLASDYDNLISEKVVKEKSNVNGAGFKLYSNICSQCHGSNGEGVNSLAPPLHESEWVSGEKVRLIKAVLYGLEGPIFVKGKLYKKPEITELMPGLASNSEITREELVSLFNYLISNFSESTEEVSKSDVEEVLLDNASRKTPFKANNLQ